jgi:2-C-methyl-D-erythritol 4-phosphate cytidylyltransferase
MNVALILAAGRGERFGNARMPKQFCDIDGKPLFVHSVAMYAVMTEIDKIVVTANPLFLEETRAALADNGLTDAAEVAVGGDTRQASIRNAVDAAWPGSAPGADDLVVIHNAASPNTKSDFVRICIHAMKGYDGVQACVPDTRTVFEKSGDRIGRVLPRSQLVYNCDPLIYRGDVFHDVTTTQRERGAAGETTTDTALELGYRIRLVESSYENIKVTNRWDLEAVRAVMTR